MWLEITGILLIILLILYFLKGYLLKKGFDLSIKVRDANIKQIKNTIKEMDIKKEELFDE